MPPRKRCRKPQRPCSPVSVSPTVELGDGGGGGPRGDGGGGEEYIMGGGVVGGSPGWESGGHGDEDGEFEDGALGDCVRSAGVAGESIGERAGVGGGSIGKRAG